MSWEEEGRGRYGEDGGVEGVERRGIAKSTSYLIAASSLVFLSPRSP